MPKLKTKVYTYKRGDKYSVDVIVSGRGNLVYINIVVPEGATYVVKKLFLEDAEVAILDKMDREYIEENSYGQH